MCVVWTTYGGRTRVNGPLSPHLKNSCLSASSALRRLRGSTSSNASTSSWHLGLTKPLHIDGGTWWYWLRGIGGSITRTGPFRDNSSPITPPQKRSLVCRKCIVTVPRYDMSMTYILCRSALSWAFWPPTGALGSSHDSRHSRPSTSRRVCSPHTFKEYIKKCSKGHKPACPSLGAPSSILVCHP